MTTRAERRQAMSIAGYEVTATSAHDAAVQAGLDWQVSLADVEAVTLNNDGVSRIEVPNTFATIRTDKDGGQAVLGTVGGRYKVFQNDEMFSALDALVDSGEARYAAAGELRGGAQVWMTLALPKEVQIAGDPHAAYLLARTSHDGSCSLGVQPIVNRLFCTNQISGIFRKDTKYSLKHTTNANLKVNDLRRMLDVIYTGIETYESVADRLLNTTVNDDDVANIFKKMWSLPSHVESSPYFRLSQGEKRQYNKALDARGGAMNIYQGATGTQDNLKGTAFGAFQAIVEYVDWFSHKSGAVRAERIVSGSFDRTKSKALELITRGV
jgi:phage/plasmid-like protein (TIGR03299 family)